MSTGQLRMGGMGGRNEKENEMEGENSEKDRGCGGRE